MKYFKKLVGEKVYLSPRASDDIEVFTKWMNDFNTTDYLGRSDAVVTLESEMEYLTSTPDSNTKAFSIISLKDTKIIGVISLEKINYKDRKATLGVFIGDENYRGNGYGTEAIKLILDFGFNYLNLNSIGLALLEFNERAHKSYLKCGFKDTGRNRQAVYLNGKYYDRLYMDILKEEFGDSSYIKNKNI